MKTTTGSTGTTKTTVQFVYDAEGEPLLLRFNGKTDYFYLYNGLGDIVGLIDSSNKVVVRYQYDSWGKVTSSEDTSGVSLATLNPFCLSQVCLQSRNWTVLSGKQILRSGSRKICECGWF